MCFSVISSGNLQSSSQVCACSVIIHISNSCDQIAHQFYSVKGRNASYECFEFFISRNYEAQSLFQQKRIVALRNVTNDWTVLNNTCVNMIGTNNHLAFYTRCDVTRWGVEVKDFRFTKYCKSFVSESIFISRLID
jgi:hypothetical protein